MPPLSALVTGGSSGGVGERVCPHIDDFNHVVTAARVGCGEDDWLESQVGAAEAVNDVDVRRHIQIPLPAWAALHHKTVTLIVAIGMVVTPGHYLLRSDYL